MRPAAIAFLLLTSGPALGQVTIEPHPAGTNAFAGRKFEVELRLRSQQAVQGRLLWNFAFDKRVVPGGRKEMAVALRPAALTVVRIGLDEAPTFKPGVVLPMVLTATVEVGGQEAATLTREIWVFPADAFHDRKKWLKDLKITVLDLGKEQATLKVFKKAGIPFEEAANATALHDIKEGVVIVGEGTSYREEPELGEQLMKLGRKGVKVLCLTPSEGSLPWLEVRIGGKENAVPASVCLRRFNFLATLDKRLDRYVWPASTFAVKDDEGKLVLQTLGTGNGWNFAEFDFEDSGGRLFACGLPLIDRWEETPAARYLLLRLLERFEAKTP